MHWIDIHCHLDAPEFGDTAAAVRALAARRGVAHCVLPSVCVGNFEAVRASALAFGDSYCLGINPLYVAQSDDDALDQLAGALQRHRDDPRLVGIGEIGLDYFAPAMRQSPLRERQQHFYIEQLKLARQYDLPVVLHSRRSVDAIVKGLRQVGGPDGRWRGVAHAFNGSFQQAMALVNLGVKLGFGGAATFERARQLRALAAGMPLEAIVLETDSPDMPPRWLYKSAEERAAGAVQGVNSPAELPRIGAELAELRGMTPQAFAQATSRNALQAMPRLRAFFDPDATDPRPLNPEKPVMNTPAAVEMTDEQAVQHILTHCRTAAVVGLSPKPHRESYHVAEFMQAHGWRMVPINPVAAASGTPILGEKVYATLSEAVQHEKIDLVDVFRNSDDVPPVVDEAIALGLPAVWLQLGIRNDAALARARAAGMVTVQDRCLKIEQARLPAARAGA